MKKRFGDKIKVLWNKVVTRATPDLWVKVLFTRDNIWYRKAYSIWGKETWYHGNTLEYDEDESTTERRLEHQRDNLRFFFGDRYNFEEIEQQIVSPNTLSKGHYRCALPNMHGFYDKEWDFIRKHPKIKHCITLKIGESCDDKTIAWLIAHEFRHYLQYKKHGSSMGTRVDGRKKRPIQVERDANKWAKKRIERLFNENQIKGQ